MTIASRKICLIGDFGVGKTSLIRRFVDRQFSDHYLSTVGVKISRKTLLLNDDSASNAASQWAEGGSNSNAEEFSTSAPEAIEQTPVESQLALQLVIWDLEGRTQFKAIAASYLQGASGAVVVGDLTRPSTLAAISEHIELYRRINPQGWLAIALNKADLLSERDMATSPWRDRFRNVPHVLTTLPTSAKRDLNVEAAFRTVASGRVAAAGEQSFHSLVEPPADRPPVEDDPTTEIVKSDTRTKKLSPSEE